MASTTDPTTHPRLAWGLAEPGLGLALGGAHHAEQVVGRRAWVDRAEALGLHSVWLPEMHFAPGVCPAPLVELADFAARTERVRLGTTSLLLPLHPPEALAAEIAALDRLCGGRLLIGLGRGFQSRMLAAFGVDPARKRDRFDESLARMLTLWGEANERRRGVHATHQRPHPPLAVAAFGPKGLAQAARHGLPYLASPVEPLGQIEENQSRHRALLPEGAERPLSLVMRTVFVSERGEELEAARSALSREMSQGAPRMPSAVRRALESPLEERAIVGRPDEVADGLGRIRKRLGIDLLILRPQIAGLERAALERSLELLSREIWPRVRARDRERPRAWRAPNPLRRG
ncbi:MAG: LLM class flavin-dependent oxidoreductase [Deltaproteobacteria bacterium]|nr:LLM class flavin-dependent oxidoreductase [Deltaproteobacteria bacterium]MBW2499264.1 LLM class flavin-dependent oxidoreductase [Deltaproteobacteria bacterium]